MTRGLNGINLTYQHKSGEMDKIVGELKVALNGGHVNQAKMAALKYPKGNHKIDAAAYLTRSLDASEALNTNIDAYHEMGQDIRAIGFGTAETAASIVVGGVLLKLVRPALALAGNSFITKTALGQTVLKGYQAYNRSKAGKLTAQAKNNRKNAEEARQQADQFRTQGNRRAASRKDAEANKLEDLATKNTQQARVNHSRDNHSRLLYGERNLNLQTINTGLRHANTRLPQAQARLNTINSSGRISRLRAGKERKELQREIRRLENRKERLEKLKPKAEEKAARQARRRARQQAQQQAQGGRQAGGRQAGGGQAGGGRAGGQ
jgi:uncharacterized membrane protein YgcG